MIERPILFSAPMVQGIMEDRKTQTRRIVKPQPVGPFQPLIGFNHGREEFAFGPENRDPNGVGPKWWRCPYGQPGDRLYVRETFRLDVAYDKAKPSEVPKEAAIWYEAGGRVGDGVAGKTRVSIHMPRWASRLVLEVTGVHVERLQAITEAEAKREGATFHDGRGIGHSGWRHDLKDVHSDARSSFARLWRDINGSGSWQENPLVWVVSFRKVT